MTLLMLKLFILLVNYGQNIYIHIYIYKSVSQDVRNSFVATAD